MKEKTKRKPTLTEALSTLLILIVSVSLGAFNGLSAVPFLIISTIWTGIIGKRCGLSVSDLEEGINEKAKSLAGTVFILIAIGFVISSWIFGGTIPAAIYYLIKVVNPSLIIVLSFVLCAILAAVMGTSYGTAGTIGVVMIGLAQTIGASMPMVAGAVISGVHVGQILSPMADMTNLSSTFCGKDVITVIKRQSYIAIPSILICIVLFTILGFWNPPTNASIDSLQLVSKQISDLFNVNLISLLPLIFLLVMSIMKLPILPVMVISSFIALGIGCALNGFTLHSAIVVAYSGFDLTSVTGIATSDIVPEIVNLVNRGGLTMMGETIIIMFCALAYAGAIMKVGSLTVIVESLFNKVNSRVSLTVATILSGIITCMATISSYITLIVPFDLMKRKYIENNYHPTETIVTSQSVGAIFQAAIPWADTAIYMSGVTGVAILSYIPYAYFCWGTCIVAIITAIFGFGFKKISDEEKEALLKSM